MKILARFRCDVVEKSEYAETVTLRAVYSNDKSSPNYSFSSATPSAIVTLTVTNKIAWGAFVPGQEYDAAFSPVEKPAA